MVVIVTFLTGIEAIIDMILRLRNSCASISGREGGNFFGVKRDKLRGVNTNTLENLTFLSLAYHAWQTLGIETGSFILVSIKRIHCN